MRKIKLYYIVNKIADKDIPAQIKVNKDTVAILAFTDRETADKYLKCMHFPDSYEVFSGNEINENKFYGKGNLLLFRDLKTIQNVYENQQTFDWSTMLTEWP